jgi:integrase
MAAKCQPGRFRVAANLYLRVARKVDGSLGRAWVLIYQSPKSGKRVEMGLGPTELVPMAQAKELALQHRIAIMNGRCPLEERRAAAPHHRRPRAIRFREVVDLFIANHSVGWRSKRHGEEFVHSLERHAYPVLGDLPVASIGKAEVTQILEAIWFKNPTTASRVRARIERVLDFAKTRDWRAGENPARWKGLLETVFPAPRKVRPVKSFAALPWEELPALWSEIRDREDLPALALQLTFLTCLRSNEALGGKWSEIDLGAGLWRIPGTRMKRGFEHWVPLSSAALAVLDKLAALRQGDLLFPGVRSGKPLGHGIMLELLAKLRPGVTVHGTVRAGFRSWARGARVCDRDVAEEVLAHVRARGVDETERAYQRDLVLPLRAAVGERWAQFLEGGEAKIIPLRA